MCRCQNPFHLSPPSPVTGPLRRHSPPPGTAAATLSRSPFRVQLCFRGQPCHAPQPRTPIHGTPWCFRGAFGVHAAPSPAIPRGAGVGRAARSQGCRNAGPGGAGCEPRDWFVPPGEDGHWVCRNRGERAGAGCRCRGRLRAGPASPSLTSRDCLRQCHPALGQDSTQQPRGRRGRPEPALVPLVQLCRGTRGTGASFPPPSLQLPGASRDTPWMCPSPAHSPGGHSIPRGGLCGESPRRAAGPGAAVPFPPPRVSALAEAGHYLPRPSQAAAPGCAPAAYLQRCKHYTPEIPSLYTTGQSLQ